MDLQLETRQEGEVAVVAAAGEVDVFTAPGLDAAISAELSAGRPRIVVDLTGGFADRHRTKPFGAQTLASIFSTT